MTSSTKKKTTMKLKKSGIEYQDLLYPLLDDNDFSLKIASRDEFSSNGYVDYVSGKLSNKEFKEASERLCNLPFSLAPHQKFVKNFMSFSTPYNSLLLYHGLGTGKTCSAMGICEEMRNYMRKTGSTQKIIVIASPNVQDNFKSQLFNKDRLQKVNGKWNLDSCVGNILIDEVSNFSSQNFTREKLVSNVNKIIRKYYTFMGYQEFANFAKNRIDKGLDSVAMSDEQKQDIKRKRIQAIFSNRLVVVDEAHNLRPSNTKVKGVGTMLMEIVKNTSNMRLLLLSATPMYNSPLEIVWLLNLMCLNDRVPLLEMNEVFDKKGNLKKMVDDNGNVLEIGAKKLAQKMSGRISFVRGDNPFTFPFSIYPSEFDEKHSVKALEPYPEKALNGVAILEPLTHLDCYLTKAGKHQRVLYKAILDELRSIMEDKDTGKKMEDMEGFGYTFLQPLLDSLIISYPLDDDATSGSSSGDKVGQSVMDYTGKAGLDIVMTSTKKAGNNVDYTYKKEIVENYGRVFSLDSLGDFSGKIKSIMESILGSDGIVMIYSQFLEGSLIPIALALEELGFERTSVAGAPSMFSNDERQTIASNNPKMKGAKYSFISGNAVYSPSNRKELAQLVSDDNKNGEQVKVVLISRAGSEGLDFKNIRQMHILEPWYNTKRVEQIIGRAVRNCSHKTLPFEKRNVQIFLHATNPIIDDEETADLYVYRYAEKGAIKMGIVSRLAKETSIDCLINTSMMDFDAEKLDLSILITTSNKKKLDYQVGDKPYTSVCDYMKKCSYVCKKANNEPYTKTELASLVSREEEDENNEIISPEFYESEIPHLITKITSLYLENYVFSLDDIHRRLKGYAGKSYNINYIVAALNAMVSNSNIKVFDTFGRQGHLVKIGNLFFFNPSELAELPSEYYEIKTPVEYKHSKLIVKQSKKAPKVVKPKLVKRKDKDNGYKPIIETLNDINTKLAVAFGEKLKLKADKDWYRLMSNVAPLVMKNENVGLSVLKKLTIHHYVDFNMPFEMKKMIIELMFNDNYGDFLASLNPSLQTTLKIVSDYLREATILNHLENKKETRNVDKNSKILFGILDGGFVFDFYVMNPSGVLEKAQPEDINDFKDTLVSHQQKMVSKFAPYVGFASIFKQNILSFKVKEMTQKRSKGARCDQAGKATNITLIKEFRDEKISGVATTKTALNDLEKVVTSGICVYQEMVLRSYNERNHKGKVWFLPLEQYKQTNIEKITI